MDSQPLFVDVSIEINASAQRIWAVLTDANLTRQWVSYFGINGMIESDWALGSLVQWKESSGTVIVEGTVTALELHHLLRFTVFDVRSEIRPEVAPEDGITYRLTSMDSATRLNVRQGDFGSMPDGEKFRGMSADIWNNVVLKVKAIAETV